VTSTAPDMATEDPLGPYRAELRSHCYRMLGSAHDAEDVLQEVSVHAWRGRDGFRGESSRRTWLHRIAANACLDELRRKERRVMPVEYGPEAGPDEGFDRPLHEVPWIEPLPVGTEEQVAERETVELAFVAAVQHLPANQRAALILFDVLGFSAAEIAELMDTTPASVNSALQRARVLVAERVPRPSQQETLAVLGDRGQRDLVARYSTAFEDHDLDGMLALLTEDATWSMPPLANWYRGHASIAGFLRSGPFTVQWRHRVTSANGQLAVGCYMRAGDAEPFAPYAIDVLQLRGERIEAVTSFIDGEAFAAFGLPVSI
jgi:RNA polymerase sigma-70 factor, ECF subfamily